MRTAAEWKEFYARERAALDLDALLEAAPSIEFPPAGALVFPHTRLEVSAALVATVAKAAARTGRDVLALGVLHGARGRDREAVARARAGDADAIAALRGVHDETGLASEEFSLDNFHVFHARACEREGVKAGVTARYPFLVGENPDDLPGIDGLRRLSRDMLVVASADPVHHGVGYGTADALDARDPATRELARRWVEEQLAALARCDYAGFVGLCARDRSDFRDAGPVLASLRPSCEWAVEELLLVDYSRALACAPPTWVAAGRIRLSPRNASQPPRARL